MAEIVYTHTSEYRSHIKDMEYGRVPTDKKTTIFQSPGKVAFVHSTLVCGMPRGHKDKRYYYWRSNRSFGFRRNAAGNVVAYSCMRPWDASLKVEWTHKTANEPFDFLEDVDFSCDPEYDAIQAFKFAVFQEFDIKSVQDVYPMLDRYNLPNYGLIPNSLKVPFRSDDWEGFTQKVFGKTRTDKRLIAAVQNTEAYFVAYAQQFRGLVPIKDITSFLENSHFDEEMEEKFVPHSPTVRPMLLRAKPNLVADLISAPLSLDDSRRINRLTRLGMKDLMRYANVSTGKNATWQDIIR